MNNTMQETSDTYTAILNALMALHGSLNLPKLKEGLGKRHYLREICTFGYEGMRQTGCTLANLKFLTSNPNAILIMTNKTCYEMTEQLILNSDTKYSELSKDLMERVHTAVEFSRLIDNGEVPDSVNVIMFDCNKHSMPRVTEKRYYKWLESLDRDVITILC